MRLVESYNQIEEHGKILKHNDRDSIILSKEPI